MDMKRFFLYAIAIAALALAGCGGGGNGVTPPVMPDPDPPVVMPMPDPDPDPEEPMVDHAAVVNGIVNPSTPGDPETARGVADSSRPGSTEVFTVTAGGIDMKPTTSVGDDQLNNVEMTNGKPNPGQFTMQEGSESTLGNFAGSVHERTVMDGDQTDTIAVYTNIQDPKDVAYSTFYSDIAAGTKAGVTSAVDGVLTLTADSGTKANLFSGSGFPTAPNTFVITKDDATTQTAMENKFNGMFNGVAGEYGCGASDAAIGCRAESDSMGNVTLSGGTWTFTPDAEDLTKVMIPDSNYDADYLSFGYWVRATEKSDGSTAYGVGTFFGGSEEYTSQDYQVLVGSASYSGKAAGMYGRKTLNTDGSVADTTSGHFTADANLKATFGQEDVGGEGTIAQNLLYTISGTVNNFMDGDEAVDAAWSLKLSADIPESGTDDNFSGATSGTGADGTWNGTFFGNADTTDDADEQYPTAVAGEFDGHFRNGHVAGAFGATR